MRVLPVAPEIITLEAEGWTALIGCFFATLLRSSVTTIQVQKITTPRIKKRQINNSYTNLGRFHRQRQQLF
jgi:hypothetical protein